MNKNVIVITGPTASGKTDLALKLSEIANIEICSADSRQIYRFMNIGTAKPTQEELSKVPHHFIDCLNPDEEFSAGKFAEQASKHISDIINKNKIPVIVGGTGFYIKSLFDGLSDVDEIDSDASKKIRAELDSDIKMHGREYLYEKLMIIDPKAAIKYSDKNPRRLIRALEYYYVNGKKLSDSFGTENPSGFFPIYYVLSPPREELYKKINDRTELMFKSGLIKETVEIIERGYSPELNSLNTVGYKECISMIFGEISLERAIELTKQNTRRYAKRQVTWLNQIKNYREIARPSHQFLNDVIEKYYETKDTSEL